MSVSTPVEMVEFDVAQPFDVVATLYHQPAIAEVVETRAALTAPDDPLYAALELEPNIRSTPTPCASTCCSSAMRTRADMFRRRSPGSGPIASADGSARAPGRRAGRDHG